MENKKNRCRLKADRIQITDKIFVRIPTVGEVLDYEQIYYNITYNLTSSPYQQMAQLDNMGIDYTAISEWELFMQNICIYSISITQLRKQIDELQKVLTTNLSESERIKYSLKLNRSIDDLDEMIEGFKLVFGDLIIEGFTILKDDKDDIVLYNPYSDVEINKAVYYELAKAIREINLYEHVKSKPANESAKKYLLEKEKKRIKAASRRKYEPYLEKLVISLVNTAEFPYNYETCENLSLYKFNQSLQQIQHKINYDNTMIGVYAGTVNTKEIHDKSVLSWIQSKKK